MSQPQRAISSLPPTLALGTGHVSVATAWTNLCPSFSSLAQTRQNTCPRGTLLKNNRKISKRNSEPKNKIHYKVRLSNLGSPWATKKRWLAKKGKSET